MALLDPRAQPARRDRKVLKDQPARKVSQVTPVRLDPKATPD